MFFPVMLVAVVLVLVVLVLVLVVLVLVLVVAIVLVPVMVVVVLVPPVLRLYQVKLCLLTESPFESTSLFRPTNILFKRKLRVDVSESSRFWPTALTSWS